MIAILKKRIGGLVKKKYATTDRIHLRATTGIADKDCNLDGTFSTMLEAAWE